MPLIETPKGSSCTFHQNKGIFHFFKCKKSLQHVHFEGKLKYTCLHVHLYSRAPVLSPCVYTVYCSVPTYPLGGSTYQGRWYAGCYNCQSMVIQDNPSILATKSMQQYFYFFKYRRFNLSEYSKCEVYFRKQNAS